MRIFSLLAAVAIVACAHQSANVPEPVAAATPEPAPAAPAETAAAATAEVAPAAAVPPAASAGLSIPASRHAPPNSHSPQGCRASSVSNPMAARRTRFHFGRDSVSPL